MVAHWPRLVKIMYAARLWFLVFCFMDLSVGLLAARSSEVIMSAKAGETCDMKHDVLLVEDSTSDSAYLQCLPAGRGIGGFWERVACPAGQKFHFTEQKCDNNPHQKQQRNLSTWSPESLETTFIVTTEISTENPQHTSTEASTSTASTTHLPTTVLIRAGLNESCAGGELCDFGTVCDYVTRMCTCPPGLMHIPNTKLCEFAQSSTITTTTTQIYPSTTTVMETTTEVEPETTTTTKRFSIALELFTQETQMFTQETQMFTQPVSPFTQASPKLISPGSSCKDAENECGGGSYCNPDNDVCSCPSETMDEAGVCMHIKMSAGLNERCDGHTKCTGWSSCIDNLCQCQPPLVQNGLQCLPAERQQTTRESKPNQPCNKGQICVGGSICSTVTLLCTCPVGSYSIGESCFPLTSTIPVNSSIGQHCDVNADCIPGAYCSASTSPPSCQCLSTHVFINEMCHKIISPGQKGCNLDEQCSASYQGAKCVMAVCSCPNGLIAQAQTCRPVSLNPGDVCQNNEETCSGGAICLRNVCVCPLGFVASHRRCVANSTKSYLVPVGGLCINKKKHVCVDGSHCKNGICQCPENTVFINSTCRKSDGSYTNEALMFPFENYLGMLLLNFSQIESPPPLAGNYCDLNSTVNNCGKYEICKGGHCQCIDGFLRISGKCRFKYVKLGEACSKEQICLEESECFANVCTCLPGLKNQGGKCVANRFKIDCPDGTTLVGNHCQNLTEEDIVIEAFCADIRQCGRGFICLNNKCTCPSGTIAKLGQCWRNPGGSCSNGEMCSGCSVCLKDMCTCPGNVAPIGGVCPANTAKPNDLCNTGQCCVGGSECVQGICLCPQGTQLISQECVQSGAASAPFGPCNNGQLCMGGSTCANGICLCSINQVVVGHKCQNISTVIPTPGETCDKQFDNCGGGSICTKGICSCPEGKFPVDNVCVPSIPGIPGDTCDKLDPCVPGVLCLNGICHCPNLMIWSVDKCINVGGNIAPGGLCSSSHQCNGGSFCLNNQCVCNENQVVVNAQCKAHLVAPNGECQPPQECTGKSQCLKGFCICSTNAIAVGSECILAFPLPGDNCNALISQCSGGSTCLLGFCVCPKSQKALNGVCSSTKISAQPGQFCDPLNYMCTGESSCINNMCTCNAKFVVVNSHCKQKQVPPNSDCQHPQQCTGGSQCLQGSCLCPANFIPNPVGICVSVQPAPGEVCDINFSICRGGSVCIQSKCTCQQGLSIINETCSTGPPLILVKPNDFCDATSYHCTGGSVCFNSKCTCPMNEVAVDGICQNASPHPFQPCKMPQICAGGSSCIDGTCICPAGKLAVNNICQNVPAPGERCSYNLPVCGGGANCINGICACSQSSSPFNGKCNKAKIGQFCTQDSYHCLDGSVCTIENLCACPFSKIEIDSRCVENYPAPGSLCLPQQNCSGGAICIQNICQCPKGFAPSLSSKCVPISENPGPNESCDPSQICSGGSTCINGVCQCPSNTQSVGNVCRTTIQTSVAGESCKDNQVCVGGSICASGICICPPNQISKGSICESASGNNLPPGGLCNTDIQCGGGSTCVSGKCACPVNSIVYSNQCILRQVNAGESCILFVQSCLGGSRCLGSICVCPQSQVALNGVCRIQPSHFVQNVALFDQKASKPGERCSLGTKCSNGSHCFNNTCKCPGGFKQDRNQCIRSYQHARSPGSFCQNDQQCLGDSVCKNFFCVCPLNTSVISGECKVVNTNQLDIGACLTSIQCSDGFTCLSGVCQCLDNTTCQGGGHFTSPPGGSCAALQQCTGGSECRSGWCICPDANMVVINGICLLSTSSTSLPNAEVISDSNEEESSTTEDKLNPIDNSRISSNSEQNSQSQISNSQVLQPNQSPNFQQSPQIQVASMPQNSLTGSFQPGFQYPTSNSQQLLNFGASSLTQLQSNGSPSLSVIQPSAVNFGWGSSSVPNKADPPISTALNGKNTHQNSFGSFINQPVPNSSINAVQGDKTYARPGAACVPSTICTGGSKCILGMCLCDDQFEIVGQICVRKVPPIVASPPMGSCQNGEACTGGAICDGTICQCLPGTELRTNLCYPLHPQSASTTRRPMSSIVVVPPLATCANGEICGGNSVCNRLTYVCECTGDMQAMHGHCLHLVNKNRTPIQNNRESASIPVASAWQNSLNAPLSGGKSEIYKPTIYALISNSDISSENPKPAVLSTNQNIYGPFIPPSLSNEPVVKQHSNVEIGLPPALVNTAPKHDSSPAVAEIASPPNGVCGRGRVCTGGSYCVHLKCRCPEGSVVNEYDICQTMVTSNPEGSNQTGTKQLGGLCSSEKDCAGSALCISGRCRCPPNTIQDGPVCISLKDSGKQRFFSAPIMHADATSLCPMGAEPIKESDADNYIQCNASRPSSCPPGWYCYATDKALEEGPYYCCPV